jgi:hypothetical protein
MGHWQMVEDVHDARGWVHVSDEVWAIIFDYLEENFNDEKPEPRLPAALQGVGCTQPTLR